MPMAAVMDNHLHRKLAPAPDRISVLVHAQDRCKKKISFNHLPYTGPGPQPASVARRNARERNRVKQVNNGFATLRQHIPPAVAASVTGGGRGASKKLSKVDTLKMAVEYIRGLQQLLDDHDSEAGSMVAADVGFDSRSYYTGSPDPTQSGLINHTPPSSEASVSPTPSFASENSPPLYTSYAPKCAYQMDNYEPMSPEDEELLDAIFCWQQQ